MSANETKEPEKVRIVVDGVEYEAPAGGRLIHFLEQIGKDIPRFCYHPGLPVAASCRQCQVESKGKGPRPGVIVSCRERIVDGMEIETQSPAARTARRAVMEFLLLNHPLDCPICDKAGECMLQDTAYGTGQAEGRTVEPRRHLPKRRSLGDKILLDNERCILCTRCVRFFEHVTGEPQLTIVDRGDRSYLDTFLGEPLRGNYQGNIVDICPVGALTLKKFRFRSRPWFMHSTETVCGLCSRGCNITVDVRDNRILRIRPRFNAAVNSWWMCDEGRLDYDAFNMRPEDGRLAEALVRDAGETRPAELEEALEAAAAALKSGPVLALLSPFATLEEGRAFRALFEDLPGAEAGFLAPRAAAKADRILHTDEPAPNRRGLADEVGLTQWPASEPPDPRGRAVLLFGFGLDVFLPRAFREALGEACALVVHGHRAPAFGKPSVLIPARTPMEKTGTWINTDGLAQALRPALKAPVLVPEDLEVLAGLALRLPKGTMEVGV